MTDQTRGILWMSASVVVFIFNDALIKLAAETMPAIQAIGLRGCFATVWCGLALLASGAWRQVPTITHRSVLARGVLEAAASTFYLVALFHIPFAIATAVNMSTPLFLAILAVLVLGEDVRWRRWCAIAVGFAGVLMVIQPRPGDANLWTWVVVFASFLGASRDILGRYVPRHVPSLVVSLGSALALAFVGCAWTTVVGWQPMSLRGIGFVAASSVLLAIGYQTLMLALRSKAEISVMGAFRYASVLWALLIGFVVWGDLPNKLALGGIVVVIASGLYILRRQRERAGPRHAQRIVP
ncbi:MAG: DMT family transporter [Proteobacteria bacterium]|nr:DMT family transporter [Pseudomonadota bacterium]